MNSDQEFDNESIKNPSNFRYCLRHAQAGLLNFEYRHKIFSYKLLPYLINYYHMVRNHRNGYI